jgi:hypothetical protein
MPLGIIRAFSQRELTSEPAAIPVSPSIILLMDQETRRLGEEFTGKQLVSLTLDDAGWSTRIFENLVMKVDPLEPEQIVWEPLPITLGIPVQSAVPKIVDLRFAFVTLQEAEGLGHNIFEITAVWPFLGSQSLRFFTQAPVEISFASVSNIYAWTMMPPPKRSGWPAWGLIFTGAYTSAGRRVQGPHQRST